MDIFTTKLRQHLWPNRRKLEAILVFGSIVLLISYRFFDKSQLVDFGIEENILILSIVILLFLEGMATELTRATDQIRNDVSVIPDQGKSSELKRILSAYVKDRRPNEIKMIEYSASTVDSIIEDAIHEGATVKLLLKHPHSTIPDHQPDKIISKVRNLHSDLSGSRKIRIRFYKPPAGLRGRKFDEDLINVGWYTYESNDKRGTYLKGHINPTILVSADEGEEYQHIQQMFDRVFENLWSNGTTLAEFYEEDETATTATKQFQQWVDSKGSEQWIRDVSGNNQRTSN